MNLYPLPTKSIKRFGARPGRMAEDHPGYTLDMRRKYTTVISEKRHEGLMLRAAFTYANEDAQILPKGGCVYHHGTLLLSIRPERKSRTLYTARRAIPRAKGFETPVDGGIAELVCVASSLLRRQAFTHASMNTLK